MCRGARQGGAAGSFHFFIRCFQQTPSPPWPPLLTRSALTFFFLHVFKFCQLDKSLARFSWDQDKWGLGFSLPFGSFCTVWMFYHGQEISFPIIVSKLSLSFKSPSNPASPVKRFTTTPARGKLCSEFQLCFSGSFALWFTFKTFYVNMPRLSAASPDELASMLLSKPSSQQKSFWWVVAAFLMTVTRYWTWLGLRGDLECGAIGNSDIAEPWKDLG